MLIFSPTTTMSAQGAPAAKKVRKVDGSVYMEFMCTAVAMNPYPDNTLFEWQNTMFERKFTKVNLAVPAYAYMAQGKRCVTENEFVESFIEGHINHFWKWLVRARELTILDGAEISMDARVMMRVSTEQSKFTNFVELAQSGGEETLTTGELLTRSGARNFLCRLARKFVKSDMYLKYN